MRPQKPKRRENNHKTQNRPKGLYLDEISCIYCINYRGKKRGCTLPDCDFEEEKLEAIKNGRLNRKAGDEV